MPKRRLLEWDNNVPNPLNTIDLPPSLQFFVIYRGGGGKEGNLRLVTAITHDAGVVRWLTFSDDTKRLYHKAAGYVSSELDEIGV